MNQIGILTFCRYYNYGTALQAYALQHYVSQSFDCEAELVDYLERNEYVGKKLLLTRIKRFPTYIKNFKKIYIQRKNANNQAVKNRAFDEFFNTSMVLSKEEKGARLGYALISNHAFIDGNKRIGMFVMLTFLEISGVRMNYTDEDIIKAGLSVADGSMNYEQLLDWVKNHQVKELL